MSGVRISLGVQKTGHGLPISRVGMVERLRNWYGIADDLSGTFVKHVLQLDYLDTAFFDIELYCFKRD